MILYLKNTTYQEFDAWLNNKAKKYGYLVSYDEAGLIDDLGDIQIIPKKYYPLRIYLSKIMGKGLVYDHDAVFLVEKVGENIKVCPKAFSETGGERLRPILREIQADWMLPERTGEIAESAEAAVDKHERGPNAATREKIGRLRKLRKQQLHDHNPIAWTIACERIPIEPSTVKNWDRELFENWNNLDFDPY